jgi:hypothetical protein
VNYEEAADDYYKLISKDDYTLAPGIYESQIVLNNAAGTHRQVAHVVEIDINNPYTKVMPSYKGMAEGLADKKYGVVPLTEELAECMMLHGTSTGWWNPSAGNYLFEGDDVVLENAWLFLCMIEE